MAWRRGLKWIGLSLAGTGLMATIVLAAFWFWSTGDTSMAIAINLASSYLPAGQSLKTEGVRGNLRLGGHIDLVRWEMEGLVVEARQVDLKWQPKALLERRLQLDTLHVAQLNIEDKRPSSALTPLESLIWTSRIDANFAVDQVNWAPFNGTDLPQASGLSELKGHYTFDGEVHSLRLANATLAQGQYSGQASLQARAPMMLDIQVKGKVVAPIPGTAEPLSLSVTGSVHGTLAGLDATLAVGADIQPAASVAGAMTGHVNARLKPWALQPIVNVNGDFAKLDLAALWPGSPRTLLTGSVMVSPDLANGAAATTAAWRGQGQVVNQLSGPWDDRRLPLDTAKAQVIYRGGQWVIQSFAAKVGGGRVDMTGELNNPLGPGTQPVKETGWRVVTQLRNISPASLHKQWPVDRIQGHVEASGTNFKTPQVIEFEGQLNSSNQSLKSSNLKQFHLKSASAQGRWMGAWSDGKLSLKELRLQTADALLQGALDAHPAEKSALGQLQLSMPGGKAQIAGHISPQRGAGEFSMQVADVAKATQWLASLPGVPNGFGNMLPRGNGDVQGAWQGGWQDKGASIRSQFSVPFLTWGAQSATTKPTLNLRQFDAELSGNLAALTFKANGLVEYGSNRFSVQTQASGGKDVSGDWRMRVSQLQGQQVGKLDAPHWAAQINQPVDLVWKSKPNDDLITAGGGEARLTGRGPGAATLAWQPLLWRSNGKTLELQSKGAVKGIPISWLDEVAGAGLADKGLQSDLIFDGDWEVLAGATVKASAALFRRSGDIGLQADGLIAGSSLAVNQRVSAGIRQLRVSLDLTDHTLAVSARWSTDRAGSAEGKITTQIQGQVTDWNWPDDAPLTGAFQAQLPQLGVWSAIAPPGWRIRGTLDANMALAGTRRNPMWSGTLNADNLEIRSVVEGIEFGKGRLRTRLNGQRLEIEDFTLQGSSGAGSGGGQVSAKGFAVWLSGAIPGAGPLAKTRVELDLIASALRVSARADRRMSISGNLRVRLQDAKMEVRGALKTDQALFILPEEDTPSLGDDVMVRPHSKEVLSPNPKLQSNPSSTQVTGFVPDTSITLDMGPDFRVQGRGLSTRLSGNLEISSSSGTKGLPRIVGTLSTVGGRYKAYGQQLDVEAGVLRFNGPYDNPALDILAIRPTLVVRVGVQVSGTALLPRVRLYADPELSETEKLAWLVLGRSAANGGAESAVLQQAALALLGKGGKGLTGGLTEALGLDELSYRGSATNADGTSSGAAVTLGKRLSRNFYVAYERSVAGTLGTVYIFYDLTKRLTLRAQAGEQSAIDLIFTVPYD